MSRVVYVAGPMTGYPAYNFPMFNTAEETLTLLGYDVLNPAKNGSGEAWDYYMRIDVRMVLDSNAVCLLPGWEASPGARLEVSIAHALRIPTVPLSAWSRTTLPDRIEDAT